jgi:hypothetical protein
MPLEALYEAVTGPRDWRRPQPGEVLPRIVEAVPGERVVWSSFWPVSPGRRHRVGVRRRQQSPAGRPARPGTARPAGQRLGRKFGAGLRGVDTVYHQR